MQTVCIVMVYFSDLQIHRAMVFVEFSEMNDNSSINVNSSSGEIKVLSLNQQDLERFWGIIVVVYF